MASVAHFARPLGWVVDLDLRDRDAQVVADFLQQLPRPKRGAWSYDAVSVWAQLNVDWLESFAPNSLIFLDIRASRLRVLPPVIERCATLEGYVSLVGVGLVARRARDAAANAALRELTRDPRVYERLRL